MNLPQLLDQLRHDPAFSGNTTAWRHLPAKEGSYRTFPEWLDPRIGQTLARRGIEQLYSHQAEALEAVHAGENLVVVTPTASGKTLCYNLPVIDAVMRDDLSRALYLFPTKALGQDQVTELHDLVTELGIDLKTFTYDGDTPVNARKAVRLAGHVVVTNPDMLHTGILPFHTGWNRLFENLRYVVIDELHQYRGVFGSHLANVIRRLKRICRFYGSSPLFICCSATIANPAELARRLIEEEVRLIDENGAPSGERHFIFYNPPVVNRELGIRRSSVGEGQRIAANFLANDAQTIVFARSRLVVEVLLTYLKEAARKLRKPERAVRGYRGGYLPLERREIELGLRSGEVRTVVSTSALELGVNIGSLEAALLVGYPGTVAATWQRAGRAGRRLNPSLAVLVASSSPLDQFIVQHPEYFFELHPENGLVNPNNLLIMVSHLKCAAFELPFSDGERFGDENVAELLEFLEESELVRHVQGRWHWMSQSFPAESISLRTASTENVVIVDTTEKARVIGEIDAFSALTTVHDDAIYLHQSQQYHVDRLDWEEQKAYVRRVDVDYYTDANLAVKLAVLEVAEFEERPAFSRAHGDVRVNALPTIYKKIKFHTGENVGWGKIHLPEDETHTTAYWLSLREPLWERLSTEELQAGLLGLANVLVNVAPIYLMCDPRDIRVHHELRSPFNDRPTIFLYDGVPAGIGFSRKLYDIHDLLLETAVSIVQGCPCEAGCPSCVGPPIALGPNGKGHTLGLLAEVQSPESKVKSL